MTADDAFVILEVIVLTVYLAIGFVAIALIWWTEIGPPTLTKEVMDSDDPAIKILRWLGLSVIWFVSWIVWPLVAVGWCIDQLRRLAHSMKKR